MTSFSIAVPRTSVFGDFLEILPANDPSQPGHIQDLQLRGKFQLRFANRLSEPIQIPGLVRVVQISTDRFVLTYSEAPWAFRFPGEILIQSAGFGPHVRFPVVTISKFHGDERTDAAVECGSVFGISLWRHGIIPPPSIQADPFVFPSRNGPGFGFIGGLPHPTVTGPNGRPIIGVYLLPRDGFLSISFSINATASGGLPIEVDHLNVVAPNACAIRIPNQAEGHFRLGKPSERTFVHDTYLEVLPSIGREVVADVRVWPTTALELDKVERDRSSTYATAKKLICADLWLYGDSFEDVDIACKRIHTTGGERTMLLTSGDRLKFWLPLPQSNVVTSIRDAAHFSYQDPELVSPSSNGRMSRRARHYGLRIRGLGSSCETQTKLDTNALRIELRTPSLGPRTFEFVAGIPLAIGSTRINSLLVPKPSRKHGGKRVLEVPVKQAFLKVESEDRFPLQNSLFSQQHSPIRFNTNSVGSELTISLPKLMFPPGTCTSNQIQRSLVDGRFQETVEFSYVDLQLNSNLPDSADGQVRLRANDEGVYPIDGETWTERFGLFGRTVTLPSISPPGFTVTVDPVDNLSLLAPAASTQISQTRWKVSDTFERAIFSQLNIAIKYDPIQYVPASDEEALNEANILVLRDDLQQPSEIVPENGITNLMLVFSLSVAGGEQALINWIKDNFAGSIRNRLLWPIAPALCLILKDGGRYGNEIAQDPLRGNGNASPGLCFDFSSEVAVSPESLGFQADWADIDRSSPILWPRSFGRNGSRLDPTANEWKGFFLADIPAKINLNPALEAGFPVLKELFKAINDRLMLEYGWRDETGWTWNAGVSIVDGVDFTPANFDRYLEFKLLSFQTTGAGAHQLASGELQITLKRIRDDAGRPYIVKGQFSLNLADGSLGRLQVELPLSSKGRGVIDTTSIPGIKQLRIDRFETDLKKLYIEMAMIPDDDLAKYLPIFSPELQGMIAIDLVNAPGENPFTITALMSDVKRSTLLGKFACSIQAIRVMFEEADGTERNTTLVNAILGLGRGTFGSVGATISAVNDGSSDWDFDVAINRIGGGIALGGVSVAATVQWRNPLAGDNGGALPAGDPAVTSRDLWGSMSISGIPGTTQSLMIDIRISSASQTALWVAVAQVGNLAIGPVVIKDLLALAAQNADLFDNGKWVVAEALTDVAGDRFRKVFPSDISDRLNWLSRWEPRAGTSTVAVLSGYLNVGGVFAMPPRNPNRAEDATTIAFAEGGLLRLSSKLVFDGLPPMGVALSYEPAKERYLAAFDLPQFKLSSDTSIDGGQMVLGFGRTPEYYRLSLGWPELLEGSDVERDWTKSVRITIAGAWPINTYWGGIFVEYEKKDEQSKLVIGLAVRAGWTYSFKINRGPAEGTADIGFAIGGVIELTFSWGDSAFSPNSVMLLPRRKRNLYREIVATHGPGLIMGVRAGGSNLLSRLVEKAHPQIQHTLSVAVQQLEDAKLSLYADVWGKAAARFMGIDVANIEIEGKARFHGEGWDPIRKMSASVDFQFTVEIGCVTHTADCGVDVVMIDR